MGKLPNLILYDFDNTLADIDTLTKFIHFVLPKHKVILGTALLSPLMLLNKCGLMSTSKLRKIAISLSFKGVSEDYLKQKGEEFSYIITADYIHPAKMFRYLNHQIEGNRVAIVSASLSYYLAPWCEENNAVLLCSELESIDGIVTGKLKGKDCSGEQKAKRVLERLDFSRYREVHAYGDSKEDIPMLKLADKAYIRWNEVAKEDLDSRHIFKLREQYW